MSRKDSSSNGAFCRYEFSVSEAYARTMQYDAPKDRRVISIAQLRKYATDNNESVRKVRNDLRSIERGDSLVLKVEGRAEKEFKITRVVKSTSKSFPKLLYY